jgi:hypothetical protein
MGPKPQKNDSLPAGRKQLSLETQKYAKLTPAIARVLGTV